MEGAKVEKDKKQKNRTLEQGTKFTSNNRKGNLTETQQRKTGYLSCNNLNNKS